MRGSRFLWLAAGSPHPTETDGTPIPPRDLRAGAERERRRIQKALDVATGDVAIPLRRQLDAVTETPRCAACGEPAAYRLDDAISDSFSTVKNRSRAWPFGGDHACAACVWACKTLALRCSLWFARLPDEHGAGGVWFVPLRPQPGWPARPDALAALLSPPPAPFVAGLPLYGIDHGGEANGQRSIWPWTGEAEHPRVHSMPSGPRLFVPADPLVKLQSKHTALYAEVTYSADRYRLQVDDAGDITVNVPLWRMLREVCEGILRDLRVAGVGATDARAALTTLRPPSGYAVPTRAWRERVAPLRARVSAAWWPLFTSLLPMPELVRQEPVRRRTRRRTRTRASYTSAAATGCLRRWRSA